MKILKLTLLVLLVSCSASGKYTGDNLFLDIKNSEIKAQEEAAAKESQAYLDYMLGELAVNENNEEQALKYFLSADQLFRESNSELNQRLAGLYLQQGKLDESLNQVEKALELNPQDQDLLLLKAGILNSLNRNDESVLAYKKLLKLNPKNLDPYVMLASLYIQQNKLIEASKTIDKFLSYDPYNFQAWHYQGKLAILQSKPVLAERYFKKAYGLSSNDDAVGKSLLQLYLSQGRLDAAEKLAKEIIKKDPGNMQVRQVLSQMLIAAERYDEALDQLEVLESAQKNPDDVRFKIALIQVEKHDYEEAQKQLELILSKNPQNYSATYYMAVVKFNLGDDKTAFKLLSQIPVSDEYFVRAKNFEYYLHKENKNYDQARSAIAEVYKLSPNDYRALSYYVSALRDLGEHRQALEVVKKALSKDPKEETLLFMLATIYADLEEVDQSIASMENLLEIYPENTDAMNFIAFSWAKQGKNLDRALQLINQSLTKSPKDPYYLDTLAWIYYQQMKYREAEQILASVVNSNKSDPEILEHYGDVLVKTNQRAKALTTYQAALALLKNEANDFAIKARENLETKIKQLENVR